MNLTRVILLSTIVWGAAVPAMAAPDTPARPWASALARYSVAEGLPEPPEPAHVGHRPIPLLAGALTAWLGVYPLGVLAGYAYAGDLDRGWEAVRWQMAGAGVGAAIGLAAAPVIIWATPPRGGPHGDAFSMLWWVVGPAMGAMAAHWLVGLAAGVDAYGVASRRGESASD